MIKFVSDLRQVGGFLRVLRFPPTNKTDSHNIAEILFESGVKQHNPYQSRMNNQEKLATLGTQYTEKKTITAQKSKEMRNTEPTKKNENETRCA
jgi:hypothetical protein